MAIPLATIVRVDECEAEGRERSHRGLADGTWVWLRQVGVWGHALIGYNRTFYVLSIFRKFHRLSKVFDC